MTATDRLVAALREHDSCPRQSGGSWAARCPAHEDHNPSLSVRQIEGQALVHCHADCPTEDVVAALGLTMSDLFDEPGVGAKYTYTNRSGQAMRYVHRTPDKSFRQSGDTKGQPELYRLPAVINAVNNSITIFIVEGEKDCHALESVGVVATTSPMGASNFSKVDVSPLAGAHVVVVPDQDQAGQRWLRDVMAALDGVAATAKVMKPLVGKDAADHIAAGHGLDELVPVEVFTIPSAAAQPATAQEGRRGPTAASALVDLALERYRLGLSTEDEPFAVPRTGPQVVRLLRGGKGSLRSALAATYYTASGRVAPQQALVEAMQTIEGLTQELDLEPLHLRVAQHPEFLWLDLGDPTGRAVQFSAAGWQVVETPGVLFRRTALTGALPVPERGGNIAELWSLLNVSVADQPLLLAWLVAALSPNLPHPVLAVRGEQGSGKTSATRVLAGLLDPSPAQTRKPPRDVESWITAAVSSWVVAIDNLSTITDWFSDSLCRAATGEGDTRRRLYTDTDLEVFAFKRPVIVNGIDLGSIRGDLAERLLTVELDQIGERSRRLDADLEAAWTDAHPRILGALLDLAVRVLATLPTLHLEALPRMADFARVLAAVDVVLGTDGLSTYLGQAGDQAADAVDADPVLAAITRSVVGGWEGPAAELLGLLEPPDGSRTPRDWPKDGRALTAVLRRRGPALRRLGWTVDDLGRGGKARVVRFRLAPPGDAWQAGDEAGDEGFRQATSPARQATPAAVACLLPSPRPAETPKTDRQAGDAGDKHGPPLLEALKEVREGAPPTRQDASIREGAETSPASPASPACVICCRPVRASQRALALNFETICVDCDADSMAAS